MSPQQVRGDQADRMIGYTFAKDDFVGRSSHFLRQRCLAFWLPPDSLSQPNTARARGVPENDLRIAVFTDHMGVNGMRVDVNDTADDLLQARCIEHRSRAYDAGGRQAGHFGHPLSENVNRIADNEDCPASAGEPPANVADQGGVLRSRCSRTHPADRLDRQRSPLRQHRPSRRQLLSGPRRAGRTTRHEPSPWPPLSDGFAHVMQEQPSATPECSVEIATPIRPTPCR